MPRFTLETVADYIRDSRTLLLDKIFPYRYSDDSLIVALNLSLLRTRYYRPDLFVRRFRTAVPAYDSVSGDIVPIEPQFRQAVLYGLVGHALMRDQEDVQDERATIFLQSQEYMLTGAINRPPVKGGTPAPKSPQS